MTTHAIVRDIKGWLLASPLIAVLGLFLLIPVGVIVMVSFWGSTEYSYFPAFQFDNYQFLLTSSVTLSVYLKTFLFTAITWFCCLLVGFTVAYFLAFHIRSLTVQIALFLLCTIPFWTSNIIRMISWIPFLGRNGLANNALQRWGWIDQPLEWLLFSEFAVILAFVHLFCLFMIVPIFNTMMRIDRSLIEAARDAGANGLQILRHVIIPLSKPGIMIGSIFVVTLVMGDFITVRFMSGGQSASVGRVISNEIGLLQYPAACASAVVLLLTVLLMVGAMLKMVDIRREL
ncbi:MAG: ABC transporter permease [Granulosicoccus sp.]|nr:ABC transporter permease [Granulosicoccus sp.]